MKPDRDPQPAPAEGQNIYWFGREVVVIANGSKRGRPLRFSPTDIAAPRPRRCPLPSWPGSWGFRTNTSAISSAAPGRRSRGSRAHPAAIIRPRRTSWSGDPERDLSLVKFLRGGRRGRASRVVDSRALRRVRIPGRGAVHTGAASRTLTAAARPFLLAWPTSPSSCSGVIVLDLRASVRAAGAQTSRVSNTHGRGRGVLLALLASARLRSIGFFLRTGPLLDRRWQRV
jgi:hypothetical protein